jgi:DNA primase
MPRFDLEKLLQAVDLLRLAEHYGAKFKPQRGGREHRSPCPLHGGENPTAFVVHQDNDGLWRWHCYTDCDTGGNALEFMMRARNITDFKEGIEALAEYAHVPLQDIGFAPEKAAEVAERKLRTEVLDLAARYFASQLWSETGAEALAYARSRGFTDDTLRIVGWGFSDGGPGLKKYLEDVGADMSLAAKTGLVRADGRDFTANREGQAASPKGWLIYPHRLCRARGAKPVRFAKPKPGIAT